MPGLKEDFSWLLMSRIGVMGAGLLTGGLINRALGPAGRGVLAEMQTWVGLFAVFFGLSLDTAVYHFANRARYGDDDCRRFVTVSRFVLLAALVGAAALASFARIWPGEVSAATAAFVVPLGLLLAATMVVSHLTVFFQALGQIRFVAVLGTAQSAVYVCLIAGAMLAGGLGLEFVLLALIAQQAAALFLIALRAARQGLWCGAFSGEMARGILGAGARQHVATVATFLYMKINQVLVFQFYGAQETGLFAAALNLSFAFAFIPTAFQNALYPRVIHGQDDFEVTVRALRICFYGWGGVSLLLAALAEPILLVYGGGEFRSATGVFRVLLISSWLLPLSSLIAPYIAKSGAFGLASTSAVILGVISIALNLLLIPRHAGLGAALATALTCATGFVMAIALLWYLARRSPFGFLVLRRGV